MGYEEDAREIMKKFKSMYYTQNPDKGQHLKNLKEESNKAKPTHQEKNVDITSLIKRHENSPSKTPEQNFANPDKIGTPPVNSGGSTEQGLLADIEMESPRINAPKQAPPQQPSGGGTEQGLLANIKVENPGPAPMPVNPATPSSPMGTGPAPTMGNVCSQCKTIHPPIPPGEKCPNVMEDLSDKGLDEINVNKFVSDIRTMVISQMDLKKIQDGKKFFQFTIIELMKILEGYNEE